ncbi:hypothetical protein ACWDRX_28105, partial [Streptomyces nigra]
MVDTMALLLPFGRASRTTSPSAQYPAAGLPADDEVLLDAPDDHLGPALARSPTSRSPCSSASARPPPA